MERRRKRRAKRKARRSRSRLDRFLGRLKRRIDYPEGDFARENAEDVGTAYIELSLVRDKRKSISRTFECNTRNEAKGHGKW